MQRVGAQIDKGYILAISNDGLALPEGFDPAVTKGLEMKIVQSFVRQIGER
jgi:two-component sensor histidine kinase